MEHAGSSDTIEDAERKGLGTPATRAAIIEKLIEKGFIGAAKSVMNLIDRFWVDGYWVGHTNAWEIPGTEDLKPYITAKDKGKKWLFGTVGMAVISAALAAIMMLFMKI